jgi:hypothetical protein
MAKIHVSFTLDSQEDKRLVRWLDGLPKGEKSAAIREALAAHLGQNGVSHRDILDAIEDLKRCGVAVVAQDDDKPQSDVPADVLENLNGLGL